MSVEALRADIDRFWSTIEQSSTIGVGRAGGLSRLALSDDDKKMRDQFVTWCRDADLAVEVDAVGNIFAHREGEDEGLAPVLVGSHLDTQANGGRFDGIAGVLAGLELVRTLNDAGITTRRPIRVVNWTNEEGARFPPPMLASGCFAGAYDLDWVHSRPADDGALLGEELKRIGYLGEVAPGGWEVDSYFELHIEQGPVLFEEQAQVGVVTHAYASYGMLAEFRGETAHTGPWPMEKRKNALVAAARLLVAVDEIGWKFASTGGKGTAAHLTAWPNKAGTLSDWSQVVCDVRHEDPDSATIMVEEMRTAVSEAGRRANCSSAICNEWHWGGDIFDAVMVNLVRDSAKRLGYRSRDLPSQAGHDAYFMAGVCPTAMIFTPCREGITHNNNEYASQSDLDPGLNTLLHAVIERANRA